MANYLQGIVVRVEMQSVLCCQGNANTHPLIRERNDEGYASPTIPPLHLIKKASEVTLHFLSYIVDFRESSFYLSKLQINMQNEMVQCQLTSSCDLPEALCGHLACLWTLNICGKDTLGKWCSLVRGKERKCVLGNIFLRLSMRFVFSKCDFMEPTEGEKGRGDL